MCTTMNELETVVADYRSLKALKEQVEEELKAQARTSQLNFPPAKEGHSIASDLKQTLEVSQNIREFHSTEDYTLNKFLILPVAVNRRKDRTMLYRVFFNASNASYARCFTDKEEAEHFYSELVNSGCYRNVAFQEG